MNPVLLETAFYRELGKVCITPGQPNVAAYAAGALSMTGHWGQMVAVVSSREAVIVRLGWTFKRAQFDPCAFVAAVLAALPK